VLDAPAGLPGGWLVLRPAGGDLVGGGTGLSPTRIARIIAMRASSS
jgi:hypothetical protein